MATEGYPTPAPSPTPSSTASRRTSVAPPRVAVIGSGLAGLTTAYLLRREGADVWLVEKDTQLGFHSKSIELELAHDAQSPRTRRVSGVKPETVQEDIGYSVPSPSSATTSALLQPPSPSRRRRSSPTVSTAPRPLPPPMSRSASASSSNGSPVECGMPLTPTFPHRSDTVAVDVPMRSFQGGYYPLLIALYKHLQLPLAPTNFSFSFTALPQRQRRAKTTTTRLPRKDTYFIHQGASGVSFPTIPSRAWRSPVAFVRAILSLLTVAICYIALLITSLLSWHGCLPDSVNGDGTFRDVVDGVSALLDRPSRWLPRTRLGPAFRSFAAEIVLPLFSAVGTMTAEDVWATPAIHILDYIHAGVGTSHYTLAGGRSARDVARLLAAPVRKQGLERVRLGSAIRSIRYTPCTSTGTRRVTVSLDGGNEIDVDCVVIATPARAARHLLGTLESTLAVHGEKAEARRVARMRTALADVEYCETIVTTHTDASVLPQPRDVRNINLVQPILSAAADGVATLTPDESGSETPSPSSSRVPPAQQLGEAPFFPPTRDEVYTMATHVIRPRGAALMEVYQTTNPVVPIDPSTILGIARLERALPVRDPKIFTNLSPPSGEPPLVYLAGSYVYPGIPLLEGCVGSARRIVEEIFDLRPEAATGGVDWDAGRGGRLGRLWRWRWESRGGY